MHLLLVVEGDYTASQLAGEMWQNTLRLALVFGDVGDIDTFPDNWTPTAVVINRTEPDWTINGNWKVSGPNAASFAVDDWLDIYAAPAVSALFSTNFIGPDVRVRHLKAYPIGQDGKAVPAFPYAVGTPITLSWTQAYPKGTGGSMSPPSVSIAAEHVTQQIGRRGRGRWFLPAPAAGTYTTDHGLLGSTWPGTIAQAMADLYDGLAVTNPAPSGVNVEPVVTGKPWTDYARIVGARVNNVLDGQRRRKLSLIPTSTTKPRA